MSDHKIATELVDAENAARRDAYQRGLEAGRADTVVRDYERSQYRQEITALEAERDSDAAQRDYLAAHIDALEAENERLREVLEWYADEDNYQFDHNTLGDAWAHNRLGMKARAALKKDIAADVEALQAENEAMRQQIAKAREALRDALQWIETYYPEGSLSWSDDWLPKARAALKEGD